MKYLIAFAFTSIWLLRLLAWIYCKVKKRNLYATGDIVMDVLGSVTIFWLVIALIGISWGILQ
jgi:hypothetical protein